MDAQCKCVIASAVAYQCYVRPEDVDTEGIRHITADDIICFKRMGRACRLLAQSALVGEGVITAYVEPTLVGLDSTEAAVRLNNNTISVTGEYFGVHTFQGQGAGKDPTAFAVELGLRDILEGVSPRMNPIPSGYAEVDNLAARHAYYLRTKASIAIEAEKLGDCVGGAAWLTKPMSVREMHDLAKVLREADGDLFFAGLRD